MPLKLVRSDSNARLWGACVSRFLDELDGGRGPDGFLSHLWLSHRNQRDCLLEEAAGRDLPGWLAPPFSFLSELPVRFGIERRPIGLLTGRLLVARLAGRAGRAHGFVGTAGEEAPGRGHMVDRTLSELLPEGVEPSALRDALATLPADEFSSRRNAWLVATYAAYLQHIEGRGQFDPRSIHALVAERIEAGALPAALGGARRLHIYGITSLRGRIRLFEALAREADVDVFLYLPVETEDGEWEALAEDTEMLASAGTAPRLRVQPVPDAVREASWVASSIKRLLVEGDAAPHEIAVIARSGREDTRRIHEALRRAGVPSTARLRSPLHEVPALRAVLQVFAAAAEDWAWTPLRAVLGSPYLGGPIDVRAMDAIAARSQPHGLEQWIEGLHSLEDELGSDRGWALRRTGLTATVLTRAIEEMERVARSLGDLLEARKETEWIDTTRSLLRGVPLGLRSAVNRVVGDRWDVVRLDQRGVLALDGLLREWRDLVSDSDREIDPSEWHARLRRLLESNEIAISSPSQRGVQVLEAHEAALTPFLHAFVVHANEGVFPPRPGGGLFTDEERDALARAGIPTTTREAAFEHERRLWLACVGSRRVTVCYRTADASGIPRLASLFVPPHDRTIELARTRKGLPGSATGPNAPVTRSDFLEVEMARFLRVRRSGTPKPFSTPDPFAVRSATLRAFVEEMRCGGLDEAARASGSAPFAGTTAAELFGTDRPLSQRPTPWNGELRDPVVLTYLARRFSATHQWSASQLEQAGRRPFDFLLDRVLGLQAIEAVEDEASAATIGGLVHSALEIFYRGRLGVGSEDFDAARDELEAAVETACARFEQAEGQWAGLPHVWAATRDELHERLIRFVEWEFSRPKPGTPIEVEYAFGRGSDREPVDLSGPGLDGERLPLLLGGRIDRVDRLGEAEETLRVVDYKSGGPGSAPRPAAFADGAALQVPLYMAALEVLGVGSAGVGVYRTVRAPADRAKRSAADIDASLILAREIAARVRRGWFEAVQARSAEIKDWQAGRDITRTAAKMESGTRFDPVSPASSAPA